MGALFWIKRYLLAALPLFAILAAVEWYKGSTARDDYLSAAAWAAIAAGIFTYSAWRRHRNHAACAVCADAGATTKAGNGAGKSTGGKAGKTASNNPAKTAGKAR